MSADTTSLVDKMELRRFVGRELLLWTWFETELFASTLATAEHGSFGMWLAGRLSLSEDRESTVIKGTAPGNHREAKEALLRGKTPDRATFHLSWGAGECVFALRGDTLAVAGLSPPAKPEPEAKPDVAAAPPPRRKKRAREGDAEELAKIEADEGFLERMHHARGVEGLVEALYRDFLALRLSPAWDDHVLPALEAWAAGAEVDEDAYRAARARALSSAPKPRTRSATTPLSAAAKKHHTDTKPAR
jgi:hypothetical protein